MPSMVESTVEYFEMVLWTAGQIGPGRADGKRTSPEGPQLNQRDSAPRCQMQQTSPNNIVPQFFSTKCCTGHEDFWTWAQIESKVRRSQEFKGATGARDGRFAKLNAGSRGFFQAFTEITCNYHYLQTHLLFSFIEFNLPSRPLHASAKLPSAKSPAHSCHSSCRVTGTHGKADGRHPCDTGEDTAGLPTWGPGAWGLAVWQFLRLKLIKAHWNIMTHIEIYWSFHFLFRRAADFD